jgi:phage shock protein A
LKKDIEEAITTCSKLRDDNHRLETRVKEQEQELDKTKTKMKNIKHQLSQVKKESQVKEGEEEMTKTKIEVGSPIMVRLSSGSDDHLKNGGPVSPHFITNIGGT